MYPNFIKVGDLVRSYDFEGNKNCYVEGVVIGLGVVMEGCPRYCIRVTRSVWGGVEESKRVGTHVYPPLNGTPTLLGETTEFVELAEGDYSHVI